MCGGFVLVALGAWWCLKICEVVPGQFGAVSSKTGPKLAFDQPLRHNIGCR